MSDPIDLDTALEDLLGDLAPLDGIEMVDLTAALGRVTVSAPCAGTAVPPFANSAMDGYAVASGDPRHEPGASFRVVETLFAGRPPERRLGAGECARIFTGAPLPPGADAVIAQEDAEIEGDGAAVRFRERALAGRFVRRAGGDVEIGERLVEAGVRLHAGHVALLAAAGVDRVEVRREPRIAIVTSGDELRLPGEALSPGQIHDSSRFALPAIAAPLPIRITSILHAGDSPEALDAAFAAASAQADALITAGGVSVGDADHVRTVLADGGRIAFWRLALKPGRPFAYGRWRGLPFFGLPGNPVSSLVTFLLLVRPALLTLAGVRDVRTPRRQVCLAAPVRKAPGRRDFQRARLHADGTATAFDRQDSNILSVFAAADLLLDLPRASGDLPAGAAVDAIDLRGMLGSP